MTLAQKKARENFKKAIAYRKKTGCSLKQAFAHVKGKKVGATKIIERGEKKNAKVTKVLQRVRSKKGTFKGIKKVSGASHKDTKSHNVNIRVVSGINQLQVYSDLCRRINVIEESIKRVNAANYYNTPKEKRIKKYLLANLKKQLSATKKQQAIQKKLI
jgi:hypothetical protein